MNRLSYEAEKAVWISVAVVLISAFIWGLVWVVGQYSDEAQSCEDQGGHMYSRQVGKVRYHKCVTDDDQVIRL